ncbi:uncharacterized protein LOC133478320 isoform X3 [Phyllopteryx taeniolatus]|uniref:uncharacterized protein LOC133478320 isoform X3 n=1 Tax=Phyllopteryx taeniolatus TaxID=161469 RepID=UPI002AD38941|nr:uncharacterized protein LOC133478320 isoform X3 [Phyllopteryx taeniolatus]
MAAAHQSEGDSFSDEDVSRLYCKVFRDACSVDEVRVAVKKFSEDDSEWSCIGERILDGLIEMKKMKEKKEKSYWELPLLNAGHLDALHLNNNTSPVANASALKCAHQPTQRRTRAEEDMRGVRRLQKAARQSWARLVTEGVQSILACLWPVQSPGVRGEAWGYVSYSDILLLNEVKYDLVTRLLCADMLQEHHSVHVWEALTPWQRENEEFWLEEFADEALASDDMIALAELPGAFTRYSACPESREECFTAVSLLYKLNACRRQEREDLTALVERLDKASLRLLCLYIRSATLRAQREKTALSAYLAVRQSWDAWPRVHSPCREEQAAALLRSDDDVQEHMTDFNSQSSKQALLQLLVLTQQQERTQLVRLIHGVTLEDVRKPAPTDSPKTSCIKKLQQICSSSKNQPRCDISGPPTEWSQGQLERGALCLLTHLLEIQERQTSSFLSALLDENEHPQVLRPEYQPKLQAEHLHSNLLQLLNPDAPDSNLSSREQVPHQSCTSGPAEAQNLIAGPRGSQTVADAISTQLGGVQAEDVPDKQGVCAGCGMTLGGLPYLEILCVPDTLSKTDGKGGQDDEEQDGETKKRNCEEQDLLIPLAWSTQLEDNTGHEGAPAHAVDDQMQPCGEGATAKHTLGASREEELSKPQPAEQHCGPQELHLEEGADKENGLHTNLVRGQQALLDSLDVNTTDEDRDMAKDLRAPEPTAQATGHCSINESKATKEGVRAMEPVSAVEREKTMRKLVDVHRRVERKQQRNRERQQLRVQERLSIIQSRKADEDLFGPKNTDRMRYLRRQESAEDAGQRTTGAAQKGTVFYHAVQKKEKHCRLQGTPGSSESPKQRTRRHAGPKHWHPMSVWLKAEQICSTVNTSLKTFNSQWVNNAGLADCLLCSLIIWTNLSNNSNIT